MAERERSPARGRRWPSSSAARSPGEAELRKNDRGETQRLTFRLLIPIFLIDEISVIDELSPVLGRGGFDITPRKRMLAYIIAAEKSEIAKAKLAARLGVITDLLEPLERRIGQRAPGNETSIEKVEESITALSGTLSEATGERAALLPSGRKPRRRCSGPSPSSWP